MKKQILVDMDGVLADVYSQFIRLEHEKTGILLNIEDLFGKLEEEAFPSFLELVNSNSFFRTAPLIPNSIEGLKYLNDKYKVLIVSSATEFPSSLIQKHAWLQEHYPFIKWQQMIFCGSKASITGDIMIDDHPKNLDNFKGEKILFSQPHNIYIDDLNYKRVKDWNEIMNIL